MASVNIDNAEPNLAFSPTEGGPGSALMKRLHLVRPELGTGSARTARRARERLLHRDQLDRPDPDGAGVAASVRPLSFGGTRLQRRQSTFLL